MGESPELPFLLVGDGAKEGGDRRFMRAHERGQIIQARVKRCERGGEDGRPLRHPLHQFAVTAHAGREPGDIAQMTLGIGAGIFLSEYGRNRYGDIVRFVSDVLNGVPSIVIGIVAYGLVVMRQKHFSALAGGVALAIMMVPTIARTTEQMLLLVPQAIREAAYGLGVSRWRTTLSITLRTATSGVITGVMLAFARVAGETAPLLFTAFGNQYWNWKTDQPTAALSLQIFTYAISPFDEWHRQAWAGALVLIILIVAAVAAVRIAVRHGTLAGA